MIDSSCTFVPLLLPWVDLSYPHARARSRHALSVCIAPGCSFLTNVLIHRSPPPDHVLQETIHTSSRLGIHKASLAVYLYSVNLTMTPKLIPWKVQPTWQRVEKLAISFFFSLVVQSFFSGILCSILFQVNLALINSPA